MPTTGDVQDIAFKHGRAKKRSNAAVAVLTGAFPGILLTCFLRHDWPRWLIGFAIGLIWANGFEYSYHRWLLHRPRSNFSKGHLVHHSTLGAPEEAEHVTLGSSPLNIAILFASNGIVLLAVDILLSLRITPGVLVGWTVYLMLAEEIHWRIHMQGWLPPGLRFARAYHFAHHDIPAARFNVFLPLFDFMLGNIGMPQRKIVNQARSR